MPEYSTPKVTPTETTKIPGMNGNSSGYIDAKDLLDIIRATFGQANGVATLGPDGRLTSSQLPVLADDVIVATSYATLDQPGMPDKLYITADNNKMYRWDDTLATPDYVELSVDLSAYATKTELAAEESAREADISDVKNALSATNKRIENLEEAHGSYHEVDVKSVYTIPTGKGSNWLVDGLRGVSRVANNLVKNSTFDGTTNWNWNSTNIDVSTSDGILEMTMKGDEPSVGKTAWGISQAIGKVTAGHVYLICGEFNSPSSAVGYDFNNQTVNGTVTANAWSPFNAVRTAIDHSTPTFYLFPAGLTNGQKMKVRNVHIRDLNVEFGTSDLSFLGATDSAKLATIQTNYPWLLTPSAYGTSAVNTVYEGVRSKGFNVWNEEWEGGAISLTTGQDDPNANTIRSKGYIDAVANTSYSAWVNGMPMFHIGIFFYDADKNFISYTNPNNTTKLFTTPPNCRYMRFYCSVTYGATYHNDITIAKSDTALTGYTPYRAPVTLTFPSPISLKSAGAVADTMEPCVEVKVGDDWVYKRRDTQRIGFEDMGNMSWSYDSAGLRFYSTSISNLIKGAESTSVAGNLLCKKYLCSPYFATQTVDLTIAVSTSGNIWVKDTAYTDSNAFKNAVAGIILYYEKATPVVTLSDPFIDNLISTEAGGTIESILTTPVDDSMTLGYINL